jgi:PEP-CTERM motif-containing protein
MSSPRWSSISKFALPITVVCSLLFVSNASASVINTLLSGSTGTATLSLPSLIFNNDPAPGAGCTTTLGRGCNSDVSTNTTLAFTGGPLAVGEGIYVNNNDLTLTAPSAADANNFLTFASHPNLVFSMSWPPGPGSPNTNCATANSNGASCSVFAGSPEVLTYVNGHTSVSLGVVGKASDTGVAGLAAGTNYTGGFSQTFTGLLPNGTNPTPQNIQLYFCPSGGLCTAADFASGRSITSSQSGSFTASSIPAVPEPATLSMSLLGGLFVAAGMIRRKRQRR